MYGRGACMHGRQQGNDPNMVQKHRNRGAGKSAEVQKIQKRVTEMGEPTGRVTLHLVSLNHVPNTLYGAVR